LAFVGALALVFVLYYTLPKKARWPLLLLASLGFYAFAGWRELCFVVFTVISTWLIGWRIGAMQAKQKAYVAEHRSELSREERKAYNAKQKRAQRRWLILGMALNIGILAFMITLNSTKLKNILNINIVVIGISYYTFRIMGYLIDVFWGKAQAQKNPAKLALFTIFFPQVWMGPISRYDYLSETLYSPNRFDWVAFQSGAQRIILGYFKKLVIAERLIVPSLYFILPGTKSPGLPSFDGISALLTMVVYAAALYCDFTGGMDIAIGIGECFGIKMEENFDSPFRSKNIFEYWRRWHITMGTWFRDYVFYPVSVAKPLQKLTGKIKAKHPKLARRVPVYIATIVTWFVTGIWHGAAWNFVAWGLANGIVILISQELQPLYGKFHGRFPKMKGRAYDAFQIARTFLLMAFIRAFDIYLDVPLTFQRFASIFIRPQLGALAEAVQVIPRIDWLAAGLGICLLLVGTKRLRKLPAAFWLLLVLTILVFGVYGLGYDASAFIYTRF